MLFKLLSCIFVLPVATIIFMVRNIITVALLVISLPK